MFRVVGMLISMMLALTFSDVTGEMKTVRRAVQREAAAILDTFDVLKLYDIDKTQKLRAILVDYSEAIINHEWATLAEDRPSQRVAALKNQFAEAAITLKPVNPMQNELMKLIFADFDTLSEYRITRLNVH